MDKQKLSPIGLFLLLLLASCSSPIAPNPKLSATLLQTASISQSVTFTQTAPPSPTSTETPVPTSTPTVTITPTLTPTLTATASARVELIKDLVGNRPRDWFRWDEKNQGWEIWLIYPGEQSISQEPFELLDPNGLAIGKAWSWFWGQYLIGNTEYEVKVPYVWQNYSTGEYSSWIVPLGKTDPFHGWGEKIRESLLVKDMSQQLVPGQVIEIYLNEPDTPGAMNDHESAMTIEATHWYYVGREEVLKDFLTTGNPSFQVVLTHLAQSNCPDAYQRKTSYSCRRPEEVIVITGY